MTILVVAAAVGGIAILTAVYLAAVHRRRETVQAAEGGDLSAIALAAAFAVGLAVALVDGPVAGSRTFSRWLGAIGGLLLVIGMSLRIAARRALSRFFSARLRTTEDQALITTGLYGHMRHPAYLGSLLVAIGLALMLGSWIGALVMWAGCAVALLVRIRREEALLRARFGQEFDEYARHTKRLIPGVF